MDDVAAGKLFMHEINHDDIDDAADMADAVMTETHPLDNKHCRTRASLRAEFGCRAGRFFHLCWTKHNKEGSR